PDALELAVALARQRGAAEAAMRADRRARVEIPFATGVRGLGLVGEHARGADLAEVARERALELAVFDAPEEHRVMPALDVEVRAAGVVAVVADAAVALDAAVHLVGDEGA